MELKHLKINFLGDSITEAANVDGEGYATLLGRETGAIVRNYGVGGTRVAPQHTPTVDHPRWDLDFLMRSAEMDLDADLVVVFGGTNDFGHGDAPLGTIDDDTPATFQGAYNLLLTRIRKNFPQAKLIVCTPLHRAVEEKPLREEKGEGSQYLRTYVELIRALAKKHGAALLDLYETSSVNAATLDTLTDDGLHPNHEGHAALARDVINFLETL